MARTVRLPNGTVIPALGQGTWHMGDDPRRRDAEIQALRIGMDLGMNLIDTAEMYGDGAAEHVVGEAIRGRREEVFLVSKVLPQNASAPGVRKACEQSMDRLGTDHIDLYLLHWRGSYPLAETVEGFESLVADGSIGAWGVSNFDLADLRELPESQPQTDQVLYNLSRRGIEFDLLPHCAQRSLPIMAYSPIEQGRILAEPALVDLAAQCGWTPTQLALAWTLRSGTVISIPKAADAEHTRLNAAASELILTPDIVSALDAAFPAPLTKTPLEML